MYYPVMFFYRDFRMAEVEERRYVQPKNQRAISQGRKFTALPDQVDRQLLDAQFHQRPDFRRHPARRRRTPGNRRARAARPASVSDGRLVQKEGLSGAG